MTNPTTSIERLRAYVQEQIGCTVSTATLQDALLGAIADLITPHGPPLVLPVFPPQPSSIARERVQRLGWQEVLTQLVVLPALQARLDPLTELARSLPDTTQLRPPATEQTAQTLCFDAYHHGFDRQTEKLAQHAIAIDAHCVDGYAILGGIYLLRGASELAHTWYQRGLKFRMQRQASTLGQHELPWLRAYCGAALAQWQQGAYTKAQRGFRDVLAVAPHDPVAARSFLACCLAEEAHPAAVTQLDDLVANVPDETNPYILYSRALLGFLYRPHDPYTTQLRLQAYRSNSLIPDMLAAAAPPLHVRGITQDAGSVDTAYGYVQLAHRAWSAYPAASAWLRQPVRTLAVTEG